MTDKTVRTRFAPSPTGMMHIGNLRSALYEYLVAKSQGGDFVLRIEDTDRERYVEGAVDVIYDTLESAGLKHDEGPDIGGDYGPYIQSERLDHYLPYAEKLIEEGHAYYCFCDRERLQKLHEQDGDSATGNMGYDRHCRNLSADEVKANLEAGKPYVIRQKMPLEGETVFEDAVFGRISVENKELEDQILIKSDGYPTYNFANVIDDHEMRITHVVRGSEYLSSTPKYNLLYEAFGWEIPTYVHLPLILGTDGQKLSKRHGATGYSELVEAGYLPEAIINYIAFLGWAPGKDTREVFTLDELTEVFKIKGINKAPAVFDYEKLRWYNEQYIRALSPEAFREWVEPVLKDVLDEPIDWPLVTEILQGRMSVRGDAAKLLDFVEEADPYTLDLFKHKRSKLTPEICLRVLRREIDELEQLEDYNREAIHELLMGLGPDMELKTGQVMGPVRIALSGRQVTPGGSIELLSLLGKEKSLERLNAAADFLEAEIAAAE